MPQMSDSSQYQNPKQYPTSFGTRQSAPFANFVVLKDGDYGHFLSLSLNDTISH